MFSDHMIYFYDKDMSHFNASSSETSDRHYGFLASGDVWWHVFAVFLIFDMSIYLTQDTHYMLVKTVSHVWRWGRTEIATCINNVAVDFKEVTHPWKSWQLSASSQIR